MNQIFSSQQLFSNINGETNFSEETFHSSNKDGESHSNLVLSHLVKVEDKLYIVSVNIQDKKIKLILSDRDNTIVKDMTPEDLEFFFRNIKKTLPVLVKELESNSLKDKGLKKISKVSSSSKRPVSKKSSSKRPVSRKSTSGKSVLKVSSSFRDPEDVDWDKI
jgi:hypothetical protein